MSENMVRTQVYLPRNIYADLQARAKKQGITMAVQIREALESYARRIKHEKPKEEEIEPLDLGNLFEILDELERSQRHNNAPSDLAENHDKYLYGEYSDLWYPNPSETQPKVREPRAVYKTTTKTRAPRKRRGARK